MERTILVEPEVLGLLEKNFVTITLYTDNDTEPYRANREEIKDPLVAQGTNPLYVVLAPDGETKLDTIGYTQDKAEFIGFLRAAERYFAP